MEPVSIPELSEGKYEFLNSRSFAENPVSAKEPLPAVPEPKAQEHVQIHVLGEIFENYIIAEAAEEDKLLIFDKHAAHERVLFEQLRSGASKLTSQMLLRPSETLLSMEEFSAVQENLPKLAEMGFAFDCSSPPQLRATAVPSFVLPLNIDEVVTEIAHNLVLGKRDPQVHTFNDTLHTIACKSAIRSGDHSTIQELQKLAQQVWDDENVRHCPHGRPVMFVIRKYDLEKQFRRRV